MKYHYGPRFRALHWCTEQLMSSALAQMDLTSAQGHIMGFLARQESPPCCRDIEEAFHLSHPTVCGTLNRMAKKGFIQVRPDEKDRRIKRIHVLPKGRQCQVTMVETIRRIEEQVVSGFTQEERELFSQFLSRAMDNLGANPEPIPPLKEEL